MGSVGSPRWPQDDGGHALKSANIASTFFSSAETAVAVPPAITAAASLPTSRRVVAPGASKAADAEPVRSSDLCRANEKHEL
eukprot:scaffold8477_cov112-Isochrysis_galbana.AAC.3